MKQIGWVIKQKIGATWTAPNVKVYQSEKTALRYSHGTPVVPVYIDNE